MCWSIQGGNNSVFCSSLSKSHRGVHHDVEFFSLWSWKRYIHSNCNLTYFLFLKLFVTFTPSIQFIMVCHYHQYLFIFFTVSLIITYSHELHRLKNKTSIQNKEKHTHCRWTREKKGRKLRVINTNRTNTFIGKLFTSSF